MNIQHILANECTKSTDWPTLASGDKITPESTAAAAASTTKPKSGDPYTMVCGGDKVPKHKDDSLTMKMVCDKDGNWKNPPSCESKKI